MNRSDAESPRAYLSTAEASILLPPYNHFLEHANRILDIVHEPVRNAEGRWNDYRALPPIRREVFGDRERLPLLIADYLLAAADMLTERQIETVKRWVAAFEADFHLVAHEAEGTIMLSDGVYYRVLGIQQPIERLLTVPLPLPASTVLLPFEGRITFDTLFASPPGIEIDADTHRAAVEGYRIARALGQVRTSLEPER